MLDGSTSGMQLTLEACCFRLVPFESAHEPLRSFHAAYRGWAPAERQDAPEPSSFRGYCAPFPCWYPCW